MAAEAINIDLSQIATHTASTFPFPGITELTFSGVSEGVELPASIWRSRPRLTDDEIRMGEMREAAQEGSLD